MSTPAKAPKPIIILPTTTVPFTLEAVLEAGYVPIVTDNPDSVRIIAPSAGLATPDDLLMAALHGLQQSHYDDVVWKGFGKELHRRMQQREKAAAEAKPINPAP